MAHAPAMVGGARGRTVRPETLAVSPEVLGLSLAEPWRRLAAMALDLVVIGLLSWLSGPWLGLATGSMLIVLFGKRKPVPAALMISRWICRALGAVVVFLSALSLGHSSFLRAGQIRLDAFHGGEPSAAERKAVFVPADASYGQLTRAADALQEQVDDLKKELKNQRADSRTWTGQVKAFTGALGLTFGWAGVYFTLLAGTCNGRTVGKLLLGTRAARINGASFTYFDGFVRQGGYVAGVAMGLLGFLKLLWDPNRQAVQDRMAATVVVRV